MIKAIREVEKGQRKASWGPDKNHAVRLKSKWGHQRRLAGPNGKEREEDCLSVRTGLLELGSPVCTDENEFMATKPWVPSCLVWKVPPGGGELGEMAHLPPDNFP